MPNPPRHREQQRHVQVGGRFGHDGRYYGDRDSPARRLRDVDVGWRDFHRGDRLKRGICGDHVAVDPVVQQTEEDIVTAHGGEEFLFGGDVHRIRIEIDLRDAAQSFERAHCDRLRNEYACAGHALALAQMRQAYCSSACAFTPTAPC